MQKKIIKLYAEKMPHLRTRCFTAGVLGSSIVSRVTIEVEVVGSNLIRDPFFQIDRPKARDRELPKFDATRRA